MTKVGLREAQRRGTYLRNGLVREMRPKPWLSNEPEEEEGSTAFRAEAEQSVQKAQKQKRHGEFWGNESHAEY